MKVNGPYDKPCTPGDSVKGFGTSVLAILRLSVRVAVCCAAPCSESETWKVTGVPGKFEAVGVPEMVSVVVSVLTVVVNPPGRLLAIQF